MKYKINYAIGGVLQPTIDQMQPIVTPIQTPQVRRIPISGYESHLINPLAENMTNEEIIKTCSLNKIFCQKMNWENLIRDREINIESVLNLNEPYPLICNYVNNPIHRPHCRTFYNYTKYYKYTKHFNTIAAGSHHSMALQNDGTVVVWGKNAWGQRDNIPDGLNNVVSIAAGSEHSMALQNDGTVRVWGRNDRGQCNVPDGLNNVVAIAAGGLHSMVLQNNGTVRVWGAFTQRHVPSGLNNVVSIAAGNNHSMALKNDGTVRIWGGHLPIDNNVPDRLNNGTVVSIAAGNICSMALQKDGTIVIWGRYLHARQRNVPDGLNNVVSIAAGYLHSMALKNDGTVHVWGSNDEDQLDVPDGLNNVVSIAASGGHSMALRNDGTVRVWGSNSDGQRDNIPPGLIARLP